MTNLITFPHFEPILVEDLTLDEIRLVKEMKSKMSSDAYAGYSPEEQAKYNSVRKFVEGKTLPYSTI